jgi:hypothetical protein
VVALVNESEENDKKDIILEVEDEILVKFCELNGGMEFAMPIIRKQFEKLDVDFRNPSKEDLYKIVESLLEVTQGLMGDVVAREERRYFKELLNKMESGLNS